MVDLVLQRSAVTGATNYKQANIKIGYETIFSDGTLTVSSEDADFPKELAVDGLTYDGWKTTAGGSQWIETDYGSTVAVDFFAIAKHNLGTVGGTAQPQYWDGATWQDIGTAIAPTDNDPIVWEFDSETRQRWRLELTGGASAYQIGVINAGSLLEPDSGLPSGWAFPDANENAEYSNQIAVGGAIMSRYVRRRGVQVSINIQAVTYSFAKGDWQTFLEAAHTRGFFVWWAYEGKAEIVYGATTQPPGGSFRGTMVTDLSFTMMGVER